MIEVTKEFIEQVATALLAQRDNYEGGSNTAFARKYGINPAVYSRIKSGEREGLLQPAKWISLGRELNVSLHERRWVTVETEVFKQIREEVLFCKAYAKGRIFVDNCGIGKTYTAKYLAKTEKNIFYLDCRQSKEYGSLVRALAKAIGVSLHGTLHDIKEETKYFLSAIPNPVVILDEAGALKKGAIELVLEFWNATEGRCGWYVIGANSLRSKISRGISMDRESFAELFSRLSEKFSTVVPKERKECVDFYKRLITDVISANMTEKNNLSELVNRCLIEQDGIVTGLRRAEGLLILYSQGNEAGSNC